MRVRRLAGPARCSLRPARNRTKLCRRPAPAIASPRRSSSVPVGRAYGCETIGYLLLCIWHIVKLIERGDKIAMFFDVKRGERLARERDDEWRRRRRREGERKTKGEREPREGVGLTRGKRKEKERSEKGGGSERELHARGRKNGERCREPQVHRAALSVMNPKGRCETTRTVRISSPCSDGVYAEVAESGGVGGGADSSGTGEGTPAWQSADAP